MLPLSTFWYLSLIYEVLRKIAGNNETIRIKYKPTLADLLNLSELEVARTTTIVIMQAIMKM